MYYRFLFFFAISSIFFQCQSSTSSVPFAASQHWQLSEQERNATIEPAVLNFYETVTPVPRTDAPLSKYIESSDYQAYISILMEEFSPETVDQLILDSGHNGALLEQDAIALDKVTLYQYLRRLPDRRFVVSTVYSTPTEKIPVMINVVTADSGLVHRQFWGQSFIEQKLSLR
ncbi:hypothetical protein [Tunicatimonas pelagia]|uniref:hypothetical protein n=1 Tax=Tunicatimonas pelagia TaxID=931531 RepID=UPI0026650956|nr:hypothetical protein [Tunicatimonas pelagia]WKN44056.1 hypothetical protein P0M28_03620 [Tunicatimonas pelagia]